MKPFTVCGNLENTCIYYQHACVHACVCDVFACMGMPQHVCGGKKTTWWRVFSLSILI